MLIVNGVEQVFGDHWDDFLARPLTLQRGATSKPDFDYTDMAYLFPQNDTSEILYMSFQLPHKWVEGSPIHFHIHVLQESSDQPEYAIDWRWYNVGSAPGSYNLARAVTTHKISYVSGSLHQIIGVDEPLDGTGFKISSILQVRLYRTDNVLSGDHKVIDADLHGKLNSLGSIQEYKKY